MTVIAPEFLRRLEADPDQTMSVIITVSSSAKEHTSKVEQIGLAISQTYSLRPMIAASGLAKAIVAVAAENWVQKIEPDGEVRAI